MLPAATSPPGDFLQRYRAQATRDFCDDRSGTLVLRLSFAAMVVLAGLITDELEVFLFGWFVAVVVTQSFDTWLCASLRTQSASAARHRALLPTLLVSATVYSLPIPALVMASSEVLHLGGLALGFGLVSALLARVASVPRLMYPMLAVYLVAMAVGIGGLAQPDGLFSVAEGLWAAVAVAITVAHMVASSIQLDRSRRRLADVAEVAQMAADAKTAFLATASHELRTPMNAILGSVDLLTREDEPANRGELLATMHTASTSLVRHLDDILDVARIEAGRIDLDPQPFAPRDLLEGLARLWAARASDKGLELVVEVADAVPQGLLGDSHRLGQIISNLVSNAIKFTETGSVRVSVGRSEGSVVVQVADTGCGIAPEAAASLFRPFVQARASEARRHGGSGLGLMIARGLATRMGGSLTLASTPGAGTTFTLMVPMAAAQPPAPRPAEPEPRLCAAAEVEGPRRILIAEDNAANRMILTRLLDMVGLQAVACETGEEALRLADLQWFDAIILDVRMPGLSGLEVAASLRAGQGPNALAPILMLSADAAREDVAAGLAAGADVYLTKPVEPARFYAALAEVCDRRIGGDGAISPGLPEAVSGADPQAA
jgi:signal transduction histidine kinase/CheY-like chemotaxis protein